MKPSHFALTLSTCALALGSSTAAQAQEKVALSFELAPQSVPDNVHKGTLRQGTAPGNQQAPLAVPAAAANPPLSSDGVIARPQGGSQSLALGGQAKLAPTLPTPPASIQPAAPPSLLLPDSSPQAAAEQAQRSPEEPIDHILKFTPGQNRTAKATDSQPAKRPPVAVLSRAFHGGNDSLVARAVGSAEGTRTPEGRKTPAYFGHVDPGNQAWNLGTFSYQHGARTPEEADSRQLRRLEAQASLLKRQAEAKNLELSLEEFLNGIDLANQAPQAALDKMGYIDWLAEARALKMSGSEAIGWARTRSFIDPDTQRWNAPGLGNNIDSISRDQMRRVTAIETTITTAGSLVSDMLNSSASSGDEVGDRPSLSAEPEDIALVFDQLFGLSATPKPVEEQRSSVNRSAAAPVKHPDVRKPDEETDRALLIGRGPDDSPISHGRLTPFPAPHVHPPKTLLLDQENEPTTAILSEN